MSRQTTSRDVIIRRATAEDIRKFSGTTDNPTIKAWAGELDGEIIGLGGFAKVMGRWIAFCDLTEKARPHKFKIARTAIMAFREAKNTGIRFIYADADLNEENSVKWLKSLGFHVDPRSGILMRWKNEDV